MREEAQPVSVGAELDRDAHVGQACRNRRRDLQMTADFELITRDALAVDAQLVERLIQCRTRAGTLLTVRDSEPGPGQVGETANTQRIAGGRRQSQFPSREV